MLKGSSLQDVIGLLPPVLMMACKNAVIPWHGQSSTQAWKNGSLKNGQAAMADSSIQKRHAMQSDLIRLVVEGLLVDEGV